MPNSDHQNKKISVFYHHPCLDGSAAIWALNEAWKEKGYRVNWIGADYNDAAKTATAVWKNTGPDTDVYFVDYVPKDTSLLESLVTGDRKVKSLTIYDHHITAKKALAKFQQDHHNDPTIKVVFDMERSGAAITWDEEHHGKPRPQIIELAQKSDLLRLKTDWEDAIAAYLDAQEIGDPKQTMAMLSKINKMPANKMYSLGKAVCDQLRATTHRVMHEDNMLWAMVDVLPGVAPVPVPYISVHPTDIGRFGMQKVIEFAGHAAPAYIAFVVRQEGGIINVSVRCDKDLHIAEAVAKHLGNKYGISGGGHGNQGSFQMTIKQHDALFGNRAKRKELFKQWHASQQTNIDSATSVEKLNSSILQYEL